MSTTLQNTPDQLACGLDMILNVTHKANWEYIWAQKQNVIETNDSKVENTKCTPPTYAIGNKVVLRQGNENKHETR